MAKRSKGCAGEHMLLVICLGSFAHDALRREVVFNSAVYMAYIQPLQGDAHLTVDAPVAGWLV